MSEQPPRLLHMRSQYGYTASTADAMSHEPEAVTAEEQRELTKRAAATSAQRERELIETAVERIRVELSTLSPSVSNRRVHSHLRAMQRQTVRLLELARAPS